QEYRIPALLIVVGFLAHWQPDSWERGITRTLARVPFVMQSLILAIVIWVLFQARSADIQPFIYFQF
ncbi:MAG: MBOAT family protein, partial [Candidatus Cloacimonetes bacterium]|nr:MBOAT family protein [Candidatus Cloacimonadota bacterium]